MPPKKAMKAMEKNMKSKSMKKAASANKATPLAIFKEIADEQQMSTKDVSQIFDNLTEMALRELEKTGTFTVPGICRIKARTKPATKAGSMSYFGVKTKKDKPAATIVSACPLISLKKQVLSHPLSVK